PGQARTRAVRRRPLVLPVRLRRMGRGRARGRGARGARGGGDGGRDRRAGPGHVELPRAGEADGGDLVRREAAAKAREIVDGVVQVYLPLPMRPSIVNVYLVRAGATWTLIDTGMNTDDSVAAFRGALTEVGIAPESIVRLVGTHHHVDHFGTSGPYQE